MTRVAGPSRRGCGAKPSRSHGTAPRCGTSAIATRCAAASRVIRTTPSVPVVLLLPAHPAVHGHLRGLTPGGGLRAPARTRHDAGLQQVQAFEEAGDLLGGALR